MNRLYGMALAMLCILLLSCNQKAENKADVQEILLNKPEEIAIAADTTAFAAPQPAGDEERQPVARKEKQVNTPPADWSKKIIKTANVSVEVKDHQKFSEMLRSLMLQQGGYIARENQQQSDYKMETTVTLKVPVDRFDETVSLVNKDVIRTNEKRINSDDVTAEYVDTRSRLESRKLVRQRYLELLKDAHKMSDILEVEQEINSIQEEIEAAAGRMNYLNQSAAMSTIELTYYQVLDAAAGEESQPGFGTELVNALKSGSSALGSLLLFLLSGWPFIGGGIAVLWFLRRRMKKVKTVTA